MQIDRFLRKNLNKKNVGNFFISNSWFYEKSCSADVLAKYFMPNGNTELIVRGQTAAQRIGVPDIYAEWLGIVAFEKDIRSIDSYTFSSKFSIAPEIKRWGTTLSIYKKIHKHFWFSVLIPFVNVSTNANLSEFEIFNERPYSLGFIGNESLCYGDPFNVTQALSHPLMKYGRIDNIKHQKTGIADITLRLGVNRKYDNKYLHDFYIQGLIPTSDKPTAEYLFEPIVGNAHHFGIGCGWKLSTVFKRFSFLSNFDYLYLFSGSEKRSFELYNGPWSRYMAATLCLPRTNPDRLINYLTKDLIVSPGSYFNALFSINYNKDKFNFEFGTNIECKSSEKVSLKGGWNENVAIAVYDTDDMPSMYSSGTYTKSYSHGAINKPMGVHEGNPDGNSLNFIRINDLNLDSARNLNMLSINPYMNIGFDGRFVNNPFNIDLGIFYKNNLSNKSVGSVFFWCNLNLYI